MDKQTDSPELRPLCAENAHSLLDELTATGPLFTPETDPTAKAPFVYLVGTKGDALAFTVERLASLSQPTLIAEVRVARVAQAFDADGIANLVADNLRALITTESKRIAAHNSLPKSLLSKPCS